MIICLFPTEIIYVDNINSSRAAKADDMHLNFFRIPIEILVEKVADLVGFE